jgi:hypothetical protein
LAHKWGFIGKHNVSFGNSQLNEFIRNAIFCAIILNPNFVVLNINVNQTAIKVNGDVAALGSTRQREIDESDVVAVSAISCFEVAWLEPSVSPTFA